MGKTLLLFVSSVAHFCLGAHCPIDLAKAARSTVEYYDTHAEEYARDHSHSSPNIDALRTAFASRLPKDGRVLDLGCGPGRDSLWFRSQGLEVVAVDPSEEMARLASQLLGAPVQMMFAQDLDLGGGFDGIWAMASLIHVPIVELEGTFRKMAAELKPGGFAYASFIEGIGIPDEGEIEPRGRFFSRVTERTVRDILSNIPELEIDEDLSKPNEDDFHGDRKPTATFHFYNIVVRKVGR